jgi:hypothetical protein
MFYRLLGMAVWKAAVAYVRQNYGRRLRAAAALTVLGVVVAGFIAARSGD